MTDILKPVQRVVITHLCTGVKTYLSVDDAAAAISTAWNEQYKATLERRQPHYPDRVLKPQHTYTAEEIKTELLIRTTYVVGEEPARFAYELESESPPAFEPEGL